MYMRGGGGSGGSRGLSAEITFCKFRVKFCVSETGGGHSARHKCKAFGISHEPSAFYTQTREKKKKWSFILAASKWFCWPVQELLREHNHIIALCDTNKMAFHSFFLSFFPSNLSRSSQECRNGGSRRMRLLDIQLRPERGGSARRCAQRRCLFY